MAVTRSASMPRLSQRIVANCSPRSEFSLAIANHAGMDFFHARLVDDDCIVIIRAKRDPVLQEYNRRIGL